MKFLKNIKNLDASWKKFIVVIILIAVGTPLGFLAARSFQKRWDEFNREEFWQKVNLPEIKEKAKETNFDEFKEKMEEIKELMEQLEKIAEETPTTTNTTTTNTSSGNY